MQIPARGPLFVPVVIAAVGWAVGSVIYSSAPGDEQLPFELTADSKLYVRRLEQLGGKSALAYQQLNDFVASLFHGSRLGVTIGVLSTVVALVWFAVARRKSSFQSG
jgi:hypothetical protein